MAPTAPKPKFAENEKLLCYHGPLLYEAKCVKIKKEGANFLYFVHYQGWNKNWDEWVNETRILKNNAENIEKKMKLQSNLSASKDKKKTPKSSKKSKSGTDSANTSRASTPVSDRSFKGATPGPLGSGVRRGLDDDLASSSSREDDREREPRRKNNRNSDSNSLDFDESETDEPSEAGGPLTSPDDRGRFKIPIPEELRYVLVSDWELLTHKKSLFTLPAKITVNMILSDFRKHVDKPGEAENLNAVTEVMYGVRDFFDATVGRQLLYNIEKPQFSAVMEQEKQKTPSDIYGSAHLLRLMVKMGGLLNQSAILEDSGVQLIENILGQFLQFLEDNRSRYFTSKNYFEAPEDYLKNTEIA